MPETEGEAPAVDVELSFDEACMILVHALTMKVLDMTGTHSMMANAVSRNLEDAGFPGLKGARILEGAFRRLNRVDEAAELLSFIAIDVPESEKQ